MRELILPHDAYGREKFAFFYGQTDAEGILEWGVEEDIFM
jgi:hypothetical protein